MHSITTLTEFQQVAQRDYYEALVMTHMIVGNEIFHMLEVQMKRMGHHLQPCKSAPAQGRW